MNAELEAISDKITIERETLERAISALSDDGPPTQLITALRAALAAQQAEPQEPVASYWLIECKNGFTGWYTSHRLDCRFFDTDPRKAYKFASKELAENEISERVQPAQTREHIADADCWCIPIIDYTDPETGVSVYIHRNPQ